MKGIIITNNKLVYEKYKDSREISFLENHTFLDILKFTRNKVHIGHKLYTHPLSGSIKPNETPYKSIIISKEKSSIDVKSISIIEESILTSVKFLDNYPTPKWNEKILKDFRTIDLSFIENVILKVSNL